MFQSKTGFLTLCLSSYDKEIMAEVKLGNTLSRFTTDFFTINKNINENRESNRNCSVGKTRLSTALF